MVRNRLVAVLALAALWLVLPATASASGEPPECFDAGPLEVEQGESIGLQPGFLCIDPEADPMTLSAVNPPTRGSLAGPDSTGGLRYTAPIGYVGTDSLTLRAKDGTSDSNIATITIQVVAQVDDSPTCFVSLGQSPPVAGERIEVEAGDVMQGTVWCSDDSPQLSYSVLAQPGHGSVTGLQRNPPLGGQDSANFRYAADAGHRGQDQFTLRVGDGAHNLDLVVLVTVVEPREEPPVCFAGMVGSLPDATGRYPVEAGDTTQGYISCSDDEGDSLTFTLLDGPDHGGFSGLQVSPPAGGYQSAGFSFTPVPPYRGPDQFTLRVSDGAHQVDTLVKVEVVEAVDNLPVCFLGLDATPGPDGRYPVEDGDTTPGSVGCTDDENAHVTFSVLQPPEHGNLSPLQAQPPFPGGIQAASFTYAPAAGYRGEDQFSIRASDGTHNVDMVIRVRAVEAVDDPPECSGWLGLANVAAGPVDVEAGEPVWGGLFCSDDEGADLAFSVAAPPGHGTLSALQASATGPGSESVSFTFTPDAAHRGADEFTLRVSDGANQVDRVVNVNVVDPVNDPPQCTVQLFPGVLGPDGRYSVEGGEPHFGSVFCSDEEQTNLTFSVLAGPGHGTLGPLQTFPQGPGFESASFTYAPDGAYRGADHLTVRVTDGVNAVEATLRVTVVEAVNDPPQCSIPGPITLEQGEGLSFDAETACHDPEGQPLTLTIIEQPEHGEISPPDEDGVYTYTAPAPPFTGQDTFAVRLSDGVNAIERTVVIQVVEAIDDPPECFDDFASVRQPASVVIPPGCFDDDDDELTYEVVQQPQNGTLTGDPANGGWTYTPKPGFTGSDSFRYTASDGTTTNGAVVEIDVDAAPRITLTPDEDTPETGTTHRVTATVRAPDGTPQAGTRVDWTIGGAGAEIVDHALTNAFGQVEIAWSRAAPGTDELEAQVDESIATARAHWRAQSDVDPPDAGPPTKPDGGALPNVHVGEILDPSDPGERYFTVSRSETTAAGVTACPGVPDSRALRLPISVVIDPGAGTVTGAELFQAPPGGGPGDSPLTPPGVKDQPTVNGDTYTFVLDCIRSGDLYVTYTLEENGDSETFTIPIGGIVLIDPQGVVYDKRVYDQRIAAGDTPEQARVAAAIEGATVRLERKVGDDFVPVLSGDPGIAPHVNPQTTGADGRYQWDVSAGVYRVVVSKDGYVMRTSDAVTIPPPVLDLHIALEPVAAPADTTAPDSTITGGPAGATTDGTPTFEFSSTEAGSTFECRIGSAAFAACSSPYTAPALAAGSYTFEVRATDAAGNTDQSPAERAFSVVAGGGPPAGGGSSGGGATGGGSTGGGSGGGGTSTDPCQGKTGNALAKCRLDQRVAQKCGSLKGKKKTLCEKRERAIAKCNSMKAKTKSQKAKRKSCVRKAKQIGATRK